MSIDLDVFTTPLALDVFKEKYSYDGKERWADTARRVVDNVCGNLIDGDYKSRIYKLILERKFIPGGRYLYAAGRDYHQVNNCMLFRAEDSREGWADLSHKSFMSLMSGGGIGADYSDVREEGALVRRTGGVATGPISLMRAINENGREILNGGMRRSAIWAGLRWNHPDIYKFISLKNWSPEQRELKSKDPSFPLPMELTNISVIYDKLFFNSYAAGNEDARRVWQLNMRQACKTAEPGFSFNFVNSRESLRNACTEVTSEDDSDKCNLGTMWINRFSSVFEFANAIGPAVLFLLCGGIYSDLPTEKIREVGSRNNRIGLGLGGIHEWLMAQGCDYEVTSELRKWLSIYQDGSDSAAKYWSSKLGVNEPKGKRALAPTGTIGIVAETTTGIEPLFCAAYARRYFRRGGWHTQYVIDGAVKRLMSNGVPLELIERSDAYALSFEQRVRFQADVQDYVDMAISSTANLHPWGSELNNDSTLDRYSKILLEYGPRLRGFTMYPDGARGGQPLTKISVAEAQAKEGCIVQEEVRQCVGGVCGA